MPRSRSTASKASPPRRASAAVAVRLVEATGSSPLGWDGAVADAVRAAKDKAPRPVAVEVVRFWADLDARARVRRYHASVKVGHLAPLAEPTASPGVAAGPVARRRPTRRA